MAIVVIAGVAPLNRHGQAAVTPYLATFINTIWTHQNRRERAK
ncbi:hypothetical protein ACVH9Z_31205 [Rhodococcus opacus]